MKNLKALALLVLTVAVLLMSFTSCDQLAGIPGFDKILEMLPGADTHEHVFGEATCTTPATCECGEVQGDALGHSYADGVCSVCGETDPNYVPPHEHNFVDGKCECGETDPNYVPPHEHNFVEGKCECGETDPNYVPPHEHNFVDGKCECGETDPNYVPPHEHNFVDGKCECGETDPNYVPPHEHNFVDGKCECGEEYVAPAPSNDWTLVTELKTGDLVIIGAPAYGKLLSTVKVSTHYNKGIDYSADNFANVTDAEIFVVTVNADGTYTFTSLTGDVLALADSYASLNKDGAHKSWTLTDRGDGTFLVKNVGRGNYLEWYNSKNNWSTYTAGNTAEYYLSFYAKAPAIDEDHVHNHISETVAPTCTEAGYTAYTCVCGDTYTTPGEPATGHSYDETPVAPTCTEAGYTTHTCACGDSYTTPGEPATGHSFVDGSCTVCFAADPDFHVHNYDANVTAPTCTAAGYTTYTCTCGDSYTGDETEKLGHVDENLDIDCDREGCTSKVAPAADTLLSNFTANNLGSKLSTSFSYYVEGTIVEVLDAKNGIFLIDDGTGETFYFRLPKNAEGVSHANWKIKLTLGDKVSVYGKINKYSTSSAPNGQYWPAMQGPVVTLLEQHTHDFTFQPATCDAPAFCVCGQSYGEPLGCSDNDGDDLCDACGKNVKYVYERFEIRTDNNSGVIDTAAGTYTWGNDNFEIQVAKGTSSQLYSTAKDHMRLYKGNQLVITNKNGYSVSTITVFLTNTTQIANFEKFLTGYTYTKNEEALSITIEINSTESITFTNPSSTTQITGIEFGYEKVSA